MPTTAERQVSWTLCLSFHKRGCEFGTIGKHFWGQKMLTDIYITEEFEKKTVDKMKYNKAAEDGSTSNYLKGSLKGVKRPLLIIFRRTLEETVLPRGMEKSWCNSTFKKRQNGIQQTSDQLDPCAVEFRRRTTSNLFGAAAVGNLSSRRRISSASPPPYIFQRFWQTFSIFSQSLLY